MVGTIYFDEDKGWSVVSGDIKYPLHLKDVKKINQTIFEGDEVKCDIVDEFTNPDLFTHVGWGMGDKCFKIKN